MSMKSGTNTLHGSAYYFSSNADWNAVTNRITGQKTTTIPWNAAGSAGLPIVKNKLFLFSIFERQNSPSYITSGYTLPTALERQGDFSQSYNANGSLRVISDPLTSRVVNNVIVRDPFPGRFLCLSLLSCDSWGRRLAHIFYVYSGLSFVLFGLQP